MLVQVKFSECFRFNGHWCLFALRKFVLFIHVLFLNSVNFAEAESKFSGICVDLFQARELFHFPTEGKTKTIEPGLVQFKYPKLLPEKGDLSQKLHVLKSLMESSGISISKGSTVVYPMAGFDVTTPLVLFPEADRYVLIDNNPAVHPLAFEHLGEANIVVNVLDANSTWVHYQDVQNSVIFRDILSSLAANVPELVIKSLEFHLDELNGVSMHVTFHSMALSGNIKELIYVGSHLGFLEGTLMNSNYRPWWSKLLQNSKPSAYILKGSQSALRMTYIRDDVDLKVREGFIADLLKHGGVVVEGASQSNVLSDNELGQNLESKRYRWELTDGDPRFAQPKKELIVDLPFSYSSVVHISTFKSYKQESNPVISQ